MKSNFDLQFFSDKKRSGRGIHCTIRCLTMYSTTTTNTTSYTTSGCDNYITLTDATRNVRHRGPPFYCDRINDNPSPDWKGSNWYRFTSDAGVMMPELPPGRRRCGTGLPGWLQGIHPKVINQPKEAKVCFQSGTGDECAYSQNIEVTNCGDFYVYYLPEVPFCYTRYCGADQA